MSRKTTRHPQHTGSGHDEGQKYRQGAQLALLAITLFVIFEAWGVYVFKSIKPDFMAYQYFRLLLEIPMLFFFYKGHKWALWLVRVGFALGTPATVYLCVLLIHRDLYLHIVSTALIPIVTTIAGCWITFASEAFLLHFKHKRHERSIYD